MNGEEAIATLVVLYDEMAKVQQYLTGVLQEVERILNAHVVGDTAGDTSQIERWYMEPDDWFKAYGPSNPYSPFKRYAGNADQQLRQTQGSNGTNGADSIPQGIHGSQDSSDSHPGKRARGYGRIA